MDTLDTGNYVTMPGEADRVLSFTGLHNFRDYGGYAAGGKRLRTGLLYRSAQHKEATPEDLARVGALGLRVVIDMRGARERQSAPCPRPEGFDARIVAVEDIVTAAAPHVAAAEGITDPAGAHRRMRESYTRIPFRAPFLATMRAWFEALAEADGPTLVHCAAGKDRTGIGVALFHHAMGVHPDDMMADFMATNDAVAAAGRGALAAPLLRKVFGPELDDETIQVLMTVQPDYLEAAFAAIVARDGSLDAYLRDAAGISEPVLAALRAKYLV